MAERPNPFSISVGILIALQSDPTSPLHQELNPSSEVQQRLSSFLEQCVLDTGTTHDDGGWSTVRSMSLRRFFAQLGAISNDNDNDDDATSNSICRLVLDYVSLAATSVDSLLDCMESLRGAITEGIVDGTSAHGIFLRKVCLGFDQLSFETTSLLWSDLQEEIKAVLQSLQQQADEENVDSNDNNPQQEDTHYWPLSASQIERALRKECFRAHETSTTTSNDNEQEDDDDSSLSFEEMEVKLRNVLIHNPELPAAHFLRFLNCIKHGERVGALDALHQYFDYAIIQGTTTTSTGTLRGGTKSSSQDILQFAAILLASLHHSFGDHALAKMATDEAVRVAQQSMDAACVAFALGWIFSNEQQQQQHQHKQRLIEGMGGGGTVGGGDAPLNAGDLLQRCASRAMEGHLRPLVAGANLCLTRYHISGAANNSSAASATTIAADSGGGTTTAASTMNSSSSPGLAELAWNSIQDASSDRPGAEAADDGAVDRPTHMTDIANSRDVMDVLSRQKLVSAGVWDYFGQTLLSGISSFLALYCHADQMLSHDVITAIQNVARMSLYGSPSVLLSSQDFDGSVLEETMATLNNKTSATADTSGTTKRTDCIYADAIIKLTSLWKLFRLPVDGTFLLGATMILHEWAIRRGEIQQALAFGTALESYLHPRLPNYWQVMIDVFSQKSLLLSRQGKWTQAKQLVQDMIEIAKTNDLKIHHASLLLQLALIHLDANPHQFTSALPPLLECLSLTDKSEMDGLHATALSVLALVHLRMRNPNRAIALLQASLPCLLQREHVWFQGEAFLNLAKSRLQLAKSLDHQMSASNNNNNKKKKNKNNSPALIRLLRSSAKDLQQSQQFFQKCQDCNKLQEVYYLQARVWNAIPGEQQRRDQASQSFLDMSKHLAQADQPLATDSQVVVCLSNITNLEEMARREVPVQSS